MPGAIGIMLSRGDGTFAPPISTALPPCTGECGPVALATADFDRDGHLDLSVADANVGVVILLGNGNGRFRQSAVIPVGHLGFNTASIAVADFNGDGIPDWALSVEGSNAVAVALGNGNGTFQVPRSFSVGDHPQSIATTDLNGDGFQDLVVPNLFSHNLSVLLGRGDGTFFPAVNYDTQRGSMSVAVGDFNGDTIPDLAVALAQTGGDRHNSVLVFLGNGDGTFQPLSSFPGGVFNPSQIVAVDFDGDGKLDLAVGNDTANDISVLLGNGDGTFRPAVSFATGNHPNSIAIGDFNNDGKPDLATANIPTDVGAYSVSVLMNDSIQRRGY